MSSIKDGQDTNQEIKSVNDIKHADRIPTQPDLDSGSDTGEKPVRERLEKTTIAKPQAATDPPKEGEDQDLMDVAPGSAMAGDSSVEDGGKRLAKKRSLEDPTAGDTKDRPESPPTPSSGGHTRKRSRDVQNGETVKGHGLRSPQPTVMEEDEEIEIPNHTNGSGENFSGDSVDMKTPPSSDEGHANEPLRSPRRKRSRDEFDSDLHRNQKIAATEESKARRSSDEERPSASDLDVTATETTEQSTANTETVSPTEPSRNRSPSLSSSKIPLTSGFSNTSSVSPFGTLSGSKSPNGNASDHQPQTSMSAFKSSGFATMSGSASPFASIGASSTTSISSPKATFGASTEPHGVSGSVFGGGTLSPASSSSKMSFGSFGGNAFTGNGFGGGFGGGQKRTTWAAPVSDTQIGNGVKEKAFGASEDSEDEDSGSDGGTEAGTEDTNEKDHEKDGEEEESHKFRIQDTDTGEENEETIFGVRGKLFQWHPETSSWAERGTGLMKLNVTRSEDEKEDGTSGSDEPKQAGARFIMRTAQTHKVILNTPIFKEMQIGDAAGKDPVGKQILFSVPVDGKVIPCTVRMGKEDDIKALYQAVKDLQDKM